MKQSGTTGKSSASRRARKLRVLHRWLGICAAAFLLLLGVTGIALNHSSALGLDSRRISSAWLLDWYGIRAPEPGLAFRTGDRWVSSAGGRLYLDGAEIAGAGLGTLVSAIEYDGTFVAASEDQLVIVSAGADVIDRIDVSRLLPGPVRALAADDSGLWLRIDGQAFVLDPISLQLGTATAATPVPAWVEPGALPEELEAGIAAAWRGQGLSPERVIMDLHSGRLFGLGGVATMDLAAIAMGFLAISGALIWFRR